MDGMKWFQNTYTRRFNCRHLVWGHLFGGRYRAVVVDEGAGRYGDTDYLSTLINYIHLNPVRAGMVDADKGRGLIDYSWSSLGKAYACAPSKRAVWMDVETGLSLSWAQSISSDTSLFSCSSSERASAVE